MLDQSKLKQCLSQINRSGYKAYKQIEGHYSFPDFELFVDHVQGDPFAEPSKIRLRVQNEIANISTDLWSNSVRKFALEDFIARTIRDTIKNNAFQSRGTGKSGIIYIDAGGQEVLERTAVEITKNWVEARIQVGLPAIGRTILSNEAMDIFFQSIPNMVQLSLKWENMDQVACIQFVECIENQEAIRCQLNEKKISAFVANGAILPRLSGISDKPLLGDGVIHFLSPKELEITFELLNPLANGKNIISGMGIPHGVSLIVGGGYHGKSTLLKSLERCVYPHIPGDGREYVISNPNGVKIRAEDGRRIEKVNISSFITNLPQDVSTISFCSEDASGSTSQAANIIEAIEVGCDLILLDEDTSAANFMVRDARMQKLVHKDHEPIKPFVDRVRELYEKKGVSTILVMGGSGDYFDMADTVIKMQDYNPHDVTKEAQKISQALPTQRRIEDSVPLTNNIPRIPNPSSFNASKGRKRVKIGLKGRDKVLFGAQDIDLRYIDQIVEKSQINSIAHAIYFASKLLVRNNLTLKGIVDMIESNFDKNNLDFLDPFHKREKHPGNFSRPRKFEIAAVINRMRSLAIDNESPKC